jgi:hypothetical protein
MTLAGSSGRQWDLQQCYWESSDRDFMSSNSGGIRSVSVLLDRLVIGYKVIHDPLLPPSHVTGAPRKTQHSSETSNDTWGRDFTASLITRLGAGVHGFCSWQGQNLYLLHSVQTDSGAHAASYPVGTGVRIKWSERETDHSPLFSSEVSNTWSYTTIPHTSLWRETLSLPY